MKDQPKIRFVRILIKRVDALRIERRRAANDAVDFVSLREQQLGEIGTVLARDSRNERAFCHQPRAPRVVDFGFWILDFGLRRPTLSKRASARSESKIQNPKSKIK